MIVKHKLHALTSLRFFAAAMIVLGHAHHIFGSFGIANLIPLSQGVSFFFILSGFILAYNYPRFLTRDSIRRFFVARFARIWPLHFVTCVLWIAIVFHFDRHSFFSGWKGFLTLLLNLSLLQSWLPYKGLALSFNGVAWSISTEMFFYILFPLAILLWDRYWATILFLSAAIVAMFLYLNNALALPSGDDYAGLGMLSTLYFNPLVRIFEFMFGVALAKVYVYPALHDFRLKSAEWLLLEVAALLAILVGLVLAGDPSRLAAYFGKSSVYYFQKQGLWFFWGALILIFALSKGPITKALSVRPLVFCGEISFALYLIHALILAVLDNYVEQAQAYGVIGAIVFWVICMGAASVLCLGVENPCRKIIMDVWERHVPFLSSVRKGYTPSSVAYMLILLTAAAGTYLYKPSTVEIMTAESVRDLLLEPGHLDRATGAFSNGAQLLGVTVRDKKDGDSYELALLMRATKNLMSDQFVALHMNDSNGAIIEKASDTMIDTSSVEIPAGVIWRQKFSVSAKAFNVAASVGIAMYHSPEQLTQVLSGQADWDGHRMIIPK